MTKIEKRVLSFLMAIVMLVGMVPQVALTARAAGTLTTSVEGLGASWTDASNSRGSASWSADGTTITGTAKGYNYWGNKTITTTLTLTNTLETEAILMFSYTLSNGSVKASVGTMGDGTYSGTLAANSSVTITLTSPSESNTGTLNIFGLALADPSSKINVLFAAPQNGSYSVNGDNITEATSRENVPGTVYTLSATAASNYVFYAWYDETNKQYLSYDVEYAYTPTGAVTIVPKFVKSDTAMFGVGTAKFADLTEAGAYAAEGSTKTIVLLNDGTLRGTHTIPSGVTMLVPFNDSNTLYTNEPANAGSTGGFIGIGGKAVAWIQPTAYRTLTMASESSITVNGAISVSAIHACGDPNQIGGAPHKSYGHIVMQEDSDIVVNQGGCLYAWGYITGDGEVTAKYGAKVYENFQFDGFRGGTVTSSMLNNDWRVFPMSQYYVQNIECKTTFEFGAQEYVSTAVFATMVGPAHNVGFIGTGGSMFVSLDKNSYITKEYDPTTDRLKIESHGTGEFSVINLRVATYDIKSENYVLPLNNNIDIVISGGTTTVNQDIALLPGTSLTIEEDATLEIGANNKLFIYDEDEWGLYTFQYSKPAQYAPLRYTPTRGTTIPAGRNSVRDAILDIQGKLIVNSNVYTTAGGADIYSSTETGEVLFTGTAGTDTVTYQYCQDGDYNVNQYKAIPVNSVWLHNSKTYGGDGTYTTTTDAEKNANYIWSNALNRWVKYQDITITYEKGAETAQGEMAVQPVLAEDMVKGNFLLNPNTYVNTGHTFNGWLNGENRYDDKATVSFYEDTTLTADWTINTHTFSVDYNLNNGASVEEHTVAYGAPLPVEVPAAPERPGYIFDGWLNTADGKVYGTEQNPMPTTMPDFALTLQAQWLTGTAKYTVETYTMNVDGTTYQKESKEYEDTTGKEVTYTANDQTGFTLKERTVKGTVAGDGSLVLKVYYDRNQYDFNLVDEGTTTTTKVYYGATLTMPADLEKEGHKFEGWQGSLPETMPANAVTLTAKWTVLSYDAIFDANGGKWADDTTEKTVSTEYSVTPTITPPTREGYTFDGWDPAVAPMGTEEVTYTAKWVADMVQYNIYIYEMDLDGNYQLTGTEIGSGIAGETVTYNPTAKEGFSVAGDSILTGTAAGDLELEVRYSRNKYKLTTVVDGVSTDTEYYFEAPVTVTAPTKEGHEFAGWEGKVLTKMPAENVTLTATWTKNSYTLTFDANGGAFADNTTSKTLTGEYDTAIGEVEEPTKTGAEFAGWNPTLPDAFPAVNQTYTAQWTDGEFTLTFNAGEGAFADGRKEAKVTGKYGSAVTKPTDPTRTGYTFKGWYLDNEGELVEIPTAMPAENRTYTAKWEINTYTVTWKNGDTELTTTTVKHGDTPVYPADAQVPTKEGNAQYTYTFAGWSPTVGEITGDTVYTATFTATVNKYTVTWQNWDGTVLETDENVPYGTVPTFDRKDPTRGQTDAFTYAFKGWDPAVVAVTGDATYTAQYTETVRTYGYVFLDAKGERLSSGEKIDYGTVITPPENPTKAADETYTYTFQGWDGNGDDEVDAELKITGEMTFEPIFTAEYIEYTVTWNVDGKKTPETYHYGEKPVYPGEGDPTKAEDAQYTYTFTGWDPAIDENTTVTGNQEYVAQFDKKTREYTIKFVDEDGTTVLDTQTVAYGTVPTYKGNTPTKAETDEYTYKHSGWTPEVVAVTGEATYTATYSSTKKSYTITWQNEDGSVIDTTTVEYGVVPTHAYVTKAADAQYTYTFAGWTPEVKPVDGEATYKATFDSTVNKYTIKFVNDNGDELQSSEVAYGEVPAYTGGTPTKDSTNEWDYTFNGWTTEIVSVTGDATYTAKYSQQKRSYTIKFVNWDDTPLENGEFVLEYGTTPAYNGTPTRPEDNYNTYEFKDWDPAVTSVTGEKTYKATYTETAKRYTVHFLNADHSQDAATFNDGYNKTFAAPAGPAKAAGQQFTYEFTGWVLAEQKNGAWVAVEDAQQIAAGHTVTITGNATYIPVFQENPRSYTITWSIDGEENSETLEYGTKLKPEAPTKKADQQYTYKFTGWEPAITDETIVTGDQTYTAKFEGILNKYTVTWIIDGVETEEEYAYGETPAHEDPTKASTATTDYTFRNWDPVITEVTGDATYTAVFTESARKYNVTWNVDDGKTTEQVANGAAITKPADPEKEHYTFAGWTPKVPDAMPTEDVTFTATWTPVNYTIQWDTDGDGNVDREETIAYGTAMPEVTGSKATDEKYSYTFDRWEPEMPATVEGNAAFTATFTETPVDYTITFNSNGGSDVEAITQGYGTAVAAPTEPTREGYTFAGWFQEDSEVTFPVEMPVGGMELTAKWTAIEYTIEFNVDGGSTVESITAGYETEIVAPADPTKNGYEFAGWYGEDGEKLETFPATMPLNGLKLTAKWTPKTYQLIYHANDGVTAETKTQNVVFGAEAELDMDAFTREGYTFLGWARTADATEAFYKTESYVHTDAEDLNLYAVWQINAYDIRFEHEDGTEISTVTQNYGTEVNQPDNPTKTGHTFAKWLDKDGEEVAFPFTVPAENVTFTASWTVNSYKVKFVDDDGTTVLKAEEELVYNTQAAAPDAPQKATTAEWKYTFAGWDYDGDDQPDDLTVIDRDMTFRAVYNKQGVEYSIYWDVNGDDIPDETTTVRYSDAIVPPAYAEIEGYQFDGWGGTVPATMPANDLMFKAQYKIREYTITFETDGGTQIQGRSLIYGAAIEMPANPEKDNHTFNGWTITGESGKTYDSAPGTMPAENLTFTAKWLVNQATFIFYNGDEIYHQYQVKDGDAAAQILPAQPPVQDGYTFRYWKNASGEEVKFDETLDLHVGQKLYAEWKANEYTVTFHANDGTDAAKEQTVTYGVQTALTENTFVREGHTFAGWATAEDGAVIAYEDKADYTHTGLADADLYAVWTVNSYKVTWTVDGKTTEETYAYGDAIVAPGNPTKEGYTFEKWTDAAGNAWAENTAMPAADVTYTANWTANVHTLTFDANGGSFADGKAQATVTGAYATAVNGPAAPNREGHTFVEWQPEVPGTMPDADVTYTAQWNVNEHTVTWMADGRKISQETVAYGDSISASVKPAKEGHTFVGWTDEDGKDVTFPIAMGDAERTFQAKFTVNRYTVTWMAEDEEVDKQEYAYGADVTAPADPEKTGYTFTGWNTELTTMPAEDVTVTAQFRINRYTVVIDEAGGNPVADITADYGSEVTLPTLTRAGYTFAGWDGMEGNTVTVPVNGMTVTAKWTPKDVLYVVRSYVMGVDGQYPNAPAGTVAEFAPTGTEITAVFETMEGFTADMEKSAAEGVVSAEETLILTLYYSRNQYTLTTNVDGTESTATYYYEAAVTAPANPVKTGYTFTGWGGEIPGTMPAEDLEFTAQWQINSHTVTWKLDNGEQDIVQAYEYGEPIAKPADPKKEGHSFTGWSEDFSGDEMPDRDLEATAQWEKQSYTIQWNIGQSVSNYTYSYGDAVTAPAVSEKTGHTFLGWAKLDDATNTVIRLPETMPAENLQLKAVYEPNAHTVTWIVDGEETTVDTAYGETVVKPADPEKEGYTFAGWGAEIPGTMSDEDLTFTAQWTVNIHTVTWMVDNTAVKTEDYAYNAKVENPATAEKEGYKFTGWDTTLESMPDHDVTINGLFTINEYTISFETDGGSEVESITENYNTYIRKPANPTKEGYTFGGWYDGENAVTFPLRMPGRNLELTAKWDVNTYKVTWIVDGARTTDEVAYGEAVTAPTHTKEGYTLGWDAEVPATMPARNLTFVAQWTVDEYKVTWTVDGVEEEQTYAYGAAVTAPTHTKEGYTLSWNAEVPATMPAKNLEFTAVWTINSHTVTWVLDNGQENVEQTYNYGEAIEAPAGIAKEGHSFNGWTPAVAATMPDEDLTYTAQWTVNNYYLTWKADSTSSVRYAYGASVTKPADPVRTGHTFVGWAKESEPETVIAVPATMPAEDLTLVAVWKVNAHTVTWNVDGALEKETYEFGATPVHDDPEKEGHTFAGWYVDGAKVNLAAYKMPDTDVTITADWTVNQYTITWKLDNGTADTETEVAYGDVITTATPVKEGCVFAGWTVTDAEGNELTAPKKMPAQDLTYTANWTTGSYTVTWNVDGKLTYVDYAYGEQIRLPDAPTKTGYVFDGWEPAVPGTMPAENRTFTAKWVADTFTVTWIVDGESVSVDYKYGESIVKRSDPAKDGWTFTGWKVTSGSTGYIPNTMPAEDLEITAQWKQNVYTVAWDVDGETTEQEYLWGDTIAVPADPVKEGHTFTGWLDAEGKTPTSTLSAGSKTYTAQWTVNSYTVQWIVDSRVTSKTYLYGDAIEVYRPSDKAYHTFLRWDAEVPATMPAEDLSFRVVWDPDDYTVTFHANNGTGETTVQTVEHNVAEPLDANPFTYEGYGFKGWATDKDSAETPYKNGDTVRVTNHMNLYAVWEEGQYTITWDVDGTQTTSTGKYGNRITLPTTPEKTGYTFAGWLDEQGNKVTAATTMPARNLTLTASWNINFYEISWDTDGDGNVDDVTTVAYGELPAHGDGERASTAQNAYTFTGWQPERTPVTGNATYKALFSAAVRSYTVTFETNDPEQNVSAVTANYGSTVNLRTLAREGYTFKGWSTDPAAAEGISGTYKVTGEAKLYAIWSANIYQISFVNEFGETLTYRQYYGTAVEPPAVPDQTGYTFQGWENQKTQSMELPETVPAEHMTFKAKWQINQYTISFANTGDSVMEPITADYGTVIGTVADPVREGYTFTGWDNAVPETMPAKNLTLTAKWQRNVYTILWDVNGDGSVDPFEMEVAEQVEHGRWPVEQIGRKSPDQKYTYIFTGWTPEVKEATQDQVYVAQFTTSINKYTVSWDFNGDGMAEDTTTVDYGVMPAYEAVKKKSDEKYTYTFAGWEPALKEVTENTMYTARFDATPVEYTINFLLDQNGGIYESVTAGYGTAVTVPADPEKTGYVFIGWDKEIPQTMPVGGMTVTGLWTINRYTITFDTDGGTEVDPITTRFGGAMTAPAAPTREGYTFAGWLPAVPATMPAEDMTLTAQWTPNQYTITFGANGGSQVEAITQDFGTPVTAPADPVREGYTFAGWDKEIPATMPAENLTLTARWTANAYEARFYTDDTMTELHETVTADCDAAFRLAAEPTREGYNFAGWFCMDQDGNEVAVPTTMPAGGLDIYAKWNVGTFTILFNTDGGSIVEAITAEYGAEITAPADPWKTGYTFTGWDADFPATMPARSMTLNAVWKINRYTIRFNTGGGSEIASITQDYNTAVTAPAENPTRAGFTFLGWDDVIPTVMPARDVTINALWAANRYTITFNTNGGTPVDPIVADFGSLLTEPAAPVKTGYVFAGWDVEFPETMPVDGLTLNAQWAVVEYAIHWDTDGDGTVDDTTNVAYDTVPVHADGSKSAIAEYTYVFSGWEPEISVVRGTATYTALFDAVPNQYTISFDTVGGSEIAPVTYAYGSVVAEPAAPTKEGYVFAGWDALPGTMPAKNIVVVAQWRVVDYTITFDTAGGSAVAPITAGYNTTIAAPNDPTREGYTFTGWTPEFPDVMPMNGLTLTATWKVNQYTIRFNTDGGTEVAPITQDYGTAVTAPAAPTREGYTFAGWSGEIPATMPAMDMSFTALWEYSYSGWLTDDIGTTYLKNGQKAYFAQWANIGGKDYYFDSEGYIAKGLYQTWSMDDDYEATFLFDEQTGIFRKDVTTVYEWNEKLYYVERGEVINYPGLVRIVREDGEINYYYFGADNEAVKDGTHQVVQNNGLLPADPYIFGADSIIEHHEDTSRNGIHEENGKKYYYIDGVKVHMGLIQEGEDYYYAAAGGELICGRSYWISRTNDLLPEKMYTFDEEGRIVFETQEPEDPTEPSDPTDPTEPVEPEAPKKNGIYAEDGTLFYYEDDVRTYGGLMQINGDYYYAKINGEVIHGRSFWITKTNGLMDEGSYAFDDAGRMILAEDQVPEIPEDPGEKKNGIYAEDGSLYYYVEDVRTYAGLIEIDGYYYYVRTGGEVVHGRSYWITKTNGILPEKSYTFDDLGRMVDVAPEESEPGKNGIYAEDGSLYYYENGLRTYGGLMEIDGYFYYAKTDGEVVNSRKYWITKTNGLKSESSYYFDSMGRMIIQEDPTAPLKNGIYAEDGSLYYYENGERTYAGLVEIDGYYYYIKTSCEAVHGCTYWITKTNDLLPAMNYTFDDQGRIQDVRPGDFDTAKNGIYKESGTLYYFVDGYKTNAGLIQIDGEYYYAKSDGAIVTGRKYYVAKTNGLMDPGYYTFDAEGRMVR